MFKFVIAALGALVLLSTPVNAVTGGTPVAPLAQAEYALVEGPKADDRSYCTAFRIGNDAFVTAGHCVGGKETGYLRDTEGRVARFTVAMFSNTDVGLADFALLQANITGKPSKQLDLKCNYVPNEGDKLTIKGFPADMGYTTVHGTVSSDTASPWGPWSTPVIRANISVSGGNSGSPAVLDKTGDVIGILVGGLPANRNLAVLTPITHVCDALESVGKLIPST